MKSLLWLACLGFALLGAERLTMLAWTHECVCEAIRDFLTAMMIAGFRLLTKPPAPPPENF